MPDNTTTIGTLIGSVIAAVSALAATRQWYVHRDDETTKQRQDREAQDRKDDLDRSDERMWGIINNLTANQERQAAEIAELRGQVKDLYGENINLRGDLVQAGITIRTLTTDNARLAGRVKELEKTKE